MPKVIKADLSNPEHAEAVVSQLSAYANDIMGGGEELPAYTRKHLVEKLKDRADCRIVLAFEDDTPVGFAISFEGFSTFMCAPILNIHDLAVSPEFRGRGMAKLLLAKLEEIAIETGCCKLTLEVLEGNTIARTTYEKDGFSPYQLDPEMGNALFYEKKLLNN